MIHLDLAPAAAGLGTGLSLIIAIGAQNAFVLRQGLRREHVLPVVAVCALSDAVLILAGVTGVGALVDRFPAALTAVRLGGAAFLVCYGALALRRAVVGGNQLPAEGGGTRPLRSVVLTCVALTWLNPHVYLDTVVLLGSVANSHGPTGRWWFAAGAVAASVTWFGALGYGARLLSTLFARPSAWRVLDVAIGVMMLTLGALLVVDR